jgi:hypothetical protein
MICSLALPRALPSIWAGSKVAWSNGSKTPFNAKDMCNTKRNKTFRLVDACRTQYERKWSRVHTNVADEKYFLFFKIYWTVVLLPRGIWRPRLVHWWKTKGKGLGRRLLWPDRGIVTKYIIFLWKGACDVKHRSQNYWCTEWGFNGNGYGFLLILVALRKKKEYCKLSVYLCAPRTDITEYQLTLIKPSGYYMYHQA